MDKQWICIRGKKLLGKEFIDILDRYRYSTVLRMCSNKVRDQYNSMICVLQDLTSDYIDGKNYIEDQLADFSKMIIWKCQRKENCRRH